MSEVCELLFRVRTVNLTGIRRMNPQNPQPGSKLRLWKPLQNLARRTLLDIARTEDEKCPRGRRGVLEYLRERMMEQDQWWESQDWRLGQREIRVL